MDEETPIYARPGAVRHECPDIDAIIYTAPTTGPGAGYYADFVIYEACFETYSAGDPKPHILFTGGSSLDHTPDLAEAKSWAHGHVKWDGCANWLLDSPHMEHACSHEDIANVGRWLSRAYDLAFLSIPEANTVTMEDEIAESRTRLDRVKE